MAFFVGEKLPLEVEVRKNGTLTSPSSITISAYVDGTAKVSDATMNQTATGKYYYDLTLDTAGKWIVYIKTTDDNGREQIDRYTFYVSEGRT